MPKIIPGKRGRPGTWKTNEVEKNSKSKNQPKEDEKETIIHVNSNEIRQNIRRSAEKRKPVIVIRGDSKVYANAVEIPYPCRVVYQPDKPLSCGAKVWIEVLGFDLAVIQPPANIVPYM
ncbi:MAG: hypothetical protein QNJ70_25165 [Xenococcaceae cyanobacterium MO_207.B15]|nr:hypothetical protein [Xenococcaceae cyanobacterium MO_207.B15]